jgi:hypothetical protein
LALAAALAAACSHADDDVVRAEVQALAMAQGEAVTKAADRVAGRGRHALLAVEAALHTADVPGRKNLVVAIRRIGDSDGVPLLLHLAAYDAAPDVRREAEWTLKSWAVGDATRAAQARAALRRLDELRQSIDSG